MIVSQDDYEFAPLRQDDVEEIRALEDRLSSRSGYPVTLIAYGPSGEAAEHAKSAEDR